MKTFKYRNINFRIFNLKDKDLVMARYKGKMRAGYVKSTTHTYEVNKEKRDAYEVIKMVHNKHIHITNKFKARRETYKKAM